MPFQITTGHRLLIVDAFVFFASIWISFVIRLGINSELEKYLLSAGFISVLAILIRIPVLWISGIYSIYWKCVGLREFLRLAFGILFGSLVLFVAINALMQNALPRSIMMIDYIVSLGIMVLIRKLAYVDFEARFPF
jgi:FlaA1/EpsC-like NDP-sugar epimerase